MKLKFQDQNTAISRFEKPNHQKNIKKQILNYHNIKMLDYNRDDIEPLRNCEPHKTESGSAQLETC